MQRPQFKKSCAMVLLRLSHMRAREVMLFFIRTIKEVVAVRGRPNPSLAVACYAHACVVRYQVHEFPPISSYAGAAPALTDFVR